MWENIAGAKRYSRPWFQHCGGERPRRPAVPTPLVDCTCRSDAVRDLDCSSRGSCTHESEEADAVDARSTAAEETHDGEDEAEDDPPGEEAGTGWGSGGRVGEEGV